MADGVKSGLASGTGGSPQTTFENDELQKISSDNEEQLLQEQLMSELETNGTKFSKEDIIFITKDKIGQIVWLEKGNSKAGLEHILNGNGTTTGHASDFEKAFGVKRNEIPEFLKKAVTNGTVISNEEKVIKGKKGFERIYSYEGNYFILAGIGTNGFIVSAYPVSD